MQPSNSTDRSSQVFNNPKLVGAIARHLRSYERKQLLRVCNAVFRAVIPYIWERVSSVYELLSLIEGVMIELHVAEDLEPYNAIDLKGSLSISQPFVRFDIYARFVQVLDLYGPRSQYISVSGWWPLVSRNRKYRLLPNLHTLSISSECNSHGPDQHMWIQALGSPSLTNLIIRPLGLNKQPDVSYPMASLTLKSIVENCPNIQWIGLFPNARLGNVGEDGESHLLMLLSPEPFYNYLSSMQHLQHLDGTTDWLQSTPLGHLGRMPNLASLAIFGRPNERFMIMGEYIPSGSFLNLRRLTLKMLHPYDTSRILMVKYFVAGLVSIELDFDIWLLDRPINKPGWFYRKIIQPLQHVKNLSALAIEANPHNVPVNPVELGADTLAIFSQLPLQTLYLTAIKMSDDCLNQDLGRSFPSVSSLALPMHRASPSKLIYFTYLPKLRILELWLDFKSEAFPDEPISPAYSLTILQPSHRRKSEISTDAMELDRMARSLLRIWPNLTGIPYPPVDLPTSTPDRWDFLNRYVATLQELQRLRNIAGAPSEAHTGLFSPPS